jgi:hypothetical protein
MTADPAAADHRHHPPFSSRVRQHGLRTAWSDKHIHPAAGNNVSGNPVTVPAPGLKAV